MSTHTQFQRLAAASLDFALTPAEQLEIDGHLATCPGCQRMLAGYQADAAGLRAMAFARPPARVQEALFAAAVGQARARVIQPWKVLVAAVLLITALLAMAAAIGALQTQPSLVITVPVVSPSPLSTRTTPSLSPGPTASALPSPSASDPVAEPSADPAAEYEPPAAACPAPPNQVRLPDVRISGGSTPGIVATRGSSSTTTCSTVGTDDAVPPEPTKVISTKPGSPLALTIPDGWGFLYVEGFDSAVGQEGTNVTPGFETPGRPTRIEVPGPARAGDSKVGFDLWLISTDGRVVGHLSITGLVRVVPATPAP